MELCNEDMINIESDLKLKLLLRVKSCGLLLYCAIKSGFVNLLFSKSTSLA